MFTHGTTQRGRHDELISNAFSSRRLMPHNVQFSGVSV